MVWFKLLIIYVKTFIERKPFKLETVLWKTEMSRNRKSIFTIKASNPVVEIRIPHNSKIRLWSVV